MFHSICRAVSGNIQRAHRACVRCAVVPSLPAPLFDGQFGLDRQALVAGPGNLIPCANWHNICHPVMCCSVGHDSSCMSPQETSLLTFRAPSSHSEVNDVRWCPWQATAFATVAGSRLDIWDIAQSVLEPVAVWECQGEPAEFQSWVPSPL